MIFFGHLGITIFLGMLLFLPILYVGIGALLPDIVDKLFFNLHLLPCGRSLAHNIFFGPAVAALIYLVTRRKDISLAILFGCYLHLIEDVTNFIPWFYPVVSYTFNCGPTTIHLGTFEIVAEVIGLSLLILTIFYQSKVIYLREKINYWLRHNVNGRDKKKIRTKKRRV